MHFKLILINTTYYKDGAGTNLMAGALSVRSNCEKSDIIAKNIKLANLENL